MKIKIEYESYTFIPSEMEKFFKLAKYRNERDMPELDKININIDNLKSSILHWIIEHCIYMGNLKEQKDETN